MLYAIQVLHLGHYNKCILNTQNWLFCCEVDKMVGYPWKKVAYLMWIKRIEVSKNYTTNMYYFVMNISVSI